MYTFVIVNEANFIDFHRNLGKVAPGKGETMKLLLIGRGDRFSAQIIDRNVKEGHEVSLVSQQNFSALNKPKLKYSWYDYPADSMNLDRVFSNVKPQQVIFTGRLFGDETWSYGPETTHYLGEVLNALNLSVKHHVDKFIFCSSTDVYPLNLSNPHLETADHNPSTYKGVLAAQAETLVDEFHDRYALTTLILRFGDIYGYHPAENINDFFSQLVHQVSKLDEVVLNANKTVVPVHLNDAADALFRCVGNTPSSVYNVAGSRAVAVPSIAQALKEHLGSKSTLVTEEGVKQSIAVEVKRIKTEMEWSEFHTLEESIAALSLDQPNVEADDVRTKSSKSKTNPVVLHVIENVVFFGVVVFLTELFKNHSVLKNVDLMTLYIISIALFFGVRQSILSIVLTFGYYLVGLQLGLGNFINVVLNADTFLKLAQYIFVGVVVGYTVDQFKTSLDQLSIEKEFLENEYAELKAINDDNVMIKHQYEKRLISYKTSLPRLYAITNQLDSLNPEVLYSSIIKVLVDVLETDSVSVYSYDKRSGYARLIGAKHDDAVFMGKSFKLSDHKDLEQKLFNNDVFVGSQWADGSPAMAGPIFHKGNIIAIILIKSMKFESLNLYQVNLLRTLTALISSSFIRAYQYEEKVHNEKYMSGAEVMVPAAFAQLVELKHQDAQQSIAQYTLLRFVHDGDPLNLYHNLANAFRSTDTFGLDSQNRLHVLLRNTSTQEVSVVESRLKDKAVQFDVIDLLSFTQG